MLSSLSAARIPAVSRPIAAKVPARMTRMPIGVSGQGRVEGAGIRNRFTTFKFRHNYSSTSAYSK